MKGRNKSIIFKWYTYVHRNPKESSEKLWKIIGEFNKMAGYKIINKSQHHFDSLAKIAGKKILYNDISDD